MTIQKRLHVLAKPIVLLKDFSLISNQRDRLLWIPDIVVVISGYTNRQFPKATSYEMIRIVVFTANEFSITSVHAV